MDESSCGTLNLSERAASFAFCTFMSCLLIIFLPQVNSSVPEMKCSLPVWCLILYVMYKVIKRLLVDASDQWRSLSQPVVCPLTPGACRGGGWKHSGLLWLPNESRWFHDRGSCFSWSASSLVQGPRQRGWSHDHNCLFTFKSIQCQCFCNLWAAVTTVPVAAVGICRITFSWRGGVGIIDTTRALKEYGHLCQWRLWDFH